MKTNLAKDTAFEPGFDTDVATRAAALPKDISLIGHVQVSMAAQVGTVTMSVERLFSLAAGDVVKMNELLEAPLTLMLNGKPVARGELLAVDDHFGIRILEVA
ncbi:MAG: FliM/FliN family flagellar motor switch protein [Lysobacteraceae bacterium]